ncbi:PLD nuclease N-terminal domain-containing protein [Paenibacillus sp. CAU 1782]
MNMMEDFFFLDELLPIIGPIIVVQFILMLIALIMCIRSDQTRGPKWMWILIIVFVNLFGPIAFMVFGRRND